jgi:hypothetical protein
MVAVIPINRVAVLSKMTGRGSFKKLRSIVPPVRVRPLHSLEVYAPDARRTDFLDDALHKRPDHRALYDDDGRHRETSLHRRSKRDALHAVVLPNHYQHIAVGQKDALREYNRY